VWAVLWFASAREGLDDDHAATAAGAWTRQHALLIGCIGRFGVFRGGRHAEQLASARDVGGTISFGKQSVMPDTMKALWHRKRRMNSSAASVIVL